MTQEEFDQLKVGDWLQHTAREELHFQIYTSDRPSLGGTRHYSSDRNLVAWNPVCWEKIVPEAWPKSPDAWVSIEFKRVVPNLPKHCTCSIQKLMAEGCKGDCK